jgi:hypothetical protein
MTAKEFVLLRHPEASCFDDEDHRGHAVWEINPVKWSSTQSVVGISWKSEDDAWEDAKKNIKNKEEKDKLIRSALKKVTKKEAEALEARFSVSDYKD